ncbi:MAG: glycosyltransferase [Candidatus Korobacteraceae bacterium]
MRVLQLIDSLALGGAEVLVKDVAPRLRKRGVDCEVAVLCPLASPLESVLQAAGVPLHTTGVNKIYSLRQVRPLARLIQNYDLVHVHLFPAQLWAVLALKRLGHRVPLVTTEHGTSNSRRRNWLRPLDAWMYPHYECIVCNSEATSEELIRWCPRIAPKVCVVPNGIPLNEFETAVPADLPRTHNMIRLVFVGRFEPPKDHGTILRALSRVPNAQLLLVGDGRLRAQTETLARSLGVAERTLFLGRRNDIAQILKASDIYVHSTAFDAFGIAACEAMAAGLPVIASDVPGLAQVVEGAGILFPAGDDRALAHELQTLIASPDRRRQMSEASRQRAQCFSIETTVDGCISMYESVLRRQAVAVEGTR